MTRKLPVGKLLFATHNLGKLEEMKLLLGPCRISVVGAAAAGLPEPEETESSFVGNARIKAHAASRTTGLVALADDSGLSVEALGGAPGVHTADWAEGPGGRNFDRAMLRVCRALMAKDAQEPWRAAFHSVLVVAWPDSFEKVFHGRVDGRLVWPTRGQWGHGYDPMFVPDGHDRTFSEMSFEEKNAISHRGKALSALMRDCFT